MHGEPGVDYIEPSSCPVQVQLVGQPPVEGCGKESSWDDEERFGGEKADCLATTIRHDQSSDGDSDGLKTENEAVQSRVERREVDSSVTPSPVNSDSDRADKQMRFTPLPTLFSGPLPPPIHPAITRKDSTVSDGDGRHGKEYAQRRQWAMNRGFRTPDEELARLNLNGQPTTSAVAVDAASRVNANEASSPISPTMRQRSTPWTVVHLPPLHLPPPPISSPMHLPPPSCLPAATGPPQPHWRRPRFTRRPVQRPPDPNRVLLYGPEVNPLFEDEWCEFVNQRDLQAKLREEIEQTTKPRQLQRVGAAGASSTPESPVTAEATAMPAASAQGRRRRVPCEIAKMRRSALRVMVEKGGELASVIRKWNEEAWKNDPPFRGYASRQSNAVGRGGYTLCNCQAALKEFTKRKLVYIVDERMRGRARQEVMLELIVRVPALDFPDTPFRVQADNLAKATQLCTLKIVTRLYDHGVVQEAELEFNRNRKDHLHPERDLPMQLRPYLEISSSVFEDILKGIEVRFGTK